MADKPSENVTITNFDELDNVTVLDMVKSVTLDQAEKIGIYLKVRENRIDCWKRQHTYQSDLCAQKIIVEWREGVEKGFQEACGDLAAALYKSNCKEAENILLKLVPDLDRSYRVAGIAADEVGATQHYTVNAVPPPHTYLGSRPHQHAHKPANKYHRFWNIYEKCTLRRFCCLFTTACVVTVIGTVLLASVVLYASVGSSHQYPIQSNVTVEIPLSMRVSGVSMQTDTCSDRNCFCTGQVCLIPAKELANIPPRSEYIPNVQLKQSVVYGIYLLEGSVLYTGFDNTQMKDDTKLLIFTDGNRRNAAQGRDYSCEQPPDDAVCHTFAPGDGKWTYKIHKTSFYYFLAIPDSALDYFEYDVQLLFYTQDQFYNANPNYCKETVDSFVPTLISLYGIFEFDRKVTFIYTKVESGSCDTLIYPKLSLTGFQGRVDVWIIAVLVTIGLIAPVLFVALCLHRRAKMSTRTRDRRTTTTQPLLESRVC